MANELAVHEGAISAPGFGTNQGFTLLQRMAKAFTNSTLVPESFRGEKNMGNCVIALEMAVRMNAAPLMVMQNLYVVHGTPSWSSKFLISTFNQCGRFSSIKYRETGKKGTDTQGIIAYATELATGELIEGPEVTIAIAKKEGWYSRNGSKWQTMPEQMLRYRAAAWMIRTTAPELSMGLQTVDETIDVYPVKIEDVPTYEIETYANTETIDVEADVKTTDTETKAEAVTPEADDDPGF